MEGADHGIILYRLHVNGTPGIAAAAVRGTPRWRFGHWPEMNCSWSFCIHWGREEGGEMDDDDVRALMSFAERKCIYYAWQDYAITDGGGGRKGQIKLEFAWVSPQKMQICGGIVCLDIQFRKKYFPMLRNASSFSPSFILPGFFSAIHHSPSMIGIPSSSRKIRAAAS